MEEANPMAKPGLSGKQQKRLDELAKDWEAECKGIFSGFSLSDLHLLLQHFAPLQQLIRQLAVSEDPVQTDVRQPVSTAYGDETLSLAQEAASVNPDQRDELAALLQQERDLRTQLENKLSDATSHLSHSQQQCQRLEQTLQQLQQQQQQQQQRHHAELDALRQSGQSPVVTLLCQDVSLATDLGLDGMGADGSADLVRCVAVLSQLDTIRQLWDLLKARCEQQLRPASDGELALLGSALAWHNHNWRQKPYQLYLPALASGFDFNKAQRALGTPPSGESLRGVWLPGISDHAGRMQKKALVVTG
ncbi:MULTISPECIES: hypothetical protein [Aeromonas]|uniref:hypothetical protein n=1 Tax=Aeromonas TaxID=642 RepID=UPI000F8F11EA|nr:MULTISPECIES: hypothetical protein [Aeromonas]MCU9924058.1 hypothetical protein [Aeromonas caviae]MEA9443108.1 hypothetical protein [Aeromonas caviae]RUR59543.1 hypothetical protein ELS78_00345 [Aeromonas veronii]GKR20459.1 hypothetical protein KAM467_35030 [Aeromonas caviae]GKR25223.1 hypothetical protein KAM468_39630 [Aeromonas caviae]